MVSEHLQFSWRSMWCDRSDNNEHGEYRLVKRLGADIVIDYKKDDFETILHDYDVVLNSSGRRDARKISARAKAGWKAHLDRRAT